MAICTWLSLPYHIILGDVWPTCWTHTSSINAVLRCLCNISFEELSFLRQLHRLFKSPEGLGVPTCVESHNGRSPRPDTSKNYLQPGQYVYTYRPLVTSLFKEHMGPELSSKLLYSEMGRIRETEVLASSLTIDEMAWNTLYLSTRLHWCQDRKPRKLGRCLKTHFAR